MLKGIPSILTPDLLKILMEMGHGDTLCIGDGNFPAAAMAQRLVRLDGHDVPPVLDAVLQFFPLDTFVAHPVTLMAVVRAGDPDPPIWDAFRKIVDHRSPEARGIEFVDRFAFYDRARAAYAIVATGETAIYANVILTKGIITES